ncbi:MAG: RNA 2',3'-cyclic phosphodiesterase [Rhodanobacteraceae bacterium]|nr:MAG: RNA 2',3'-cyclic phosphodiesterase [Rhodanobacteraceae bacterium]
MSIAAAGSGMRCFLALLPDAASRQALQRNHEALEHAAVGAVRSVRWVEPAALHLTLRFLGASGTAQIDYFKHMLPALAPALPAIPARRYGVWPNRSRPRLLVLELDAGTGLSHLAHECETQARKAGFEPEPRDFRAHVTLARLRPGCGFGILPNPPTAIGFEAIALMQSTLAQPVATYAALAREALATRHS